MDEDVVLLPEDKIKAMSLDELGAYAQQVDAHVGNVDLVVGYVILEARGRLKCHREYGEWLEEHMPGMSAREAHKKLQLAEEFYGTPYAVFRNSVLTELLQAPEEVQQEALDHHQTGGRVTARWVKEAIDRANSTVQEAKPEEVQEDVLEVLEATPQEPAVTPGEQPKAEVVLGKVEEAPKPKPVKSPPPELPGYAEPVGNHAPIYVAELRKHIEAWAKLGNPSKKVLEAIPKLQAIMDELQLDANETARPVDAVKH